MPGLGALWDSLVDCICRPPRDEYCYPDELVGGSRKLFRVGRYAGFREDLTLVNKRGLRLQCSHYFPKQARGKDGRLPCVIYCHCNSGSRRDAEEAICVLIPHGVSVFTLDFAGSGLSEGLWVTLGAEEVDDVAAAVEHLRAGGRVSTLGLWGRSMGAVTALLYSQRDPSIAGMVLDSPFSRLTDLMLEIVQEQRLPIPRPLARLALAAMKRSVNKRAGFDITKVSPVDAVAQSFIPALFGHATGDTFIRISHAEALHTAYAGDKNLIRFEGDHNSRRPEFFYNSVSIFWHNTLQLEQLLEPPDANPVPGLSTAPPAAGGTTAGGGARPPVGRMLRPPQLRPRQLLAPSPAPSGAAATADLPSRASSEPPPPAAAAAAVATASAIASGGGSSSGWRDGEDEGTDLTGPGAADRSAPWEPRLWESELDKTMRERQRFRRMAGGLHSPIGGTSTSTLAPTAAAPGAHGGSFRNSAELAHMFATATDDSMVARLLGEEPRWSDLPGPGAEAASGRPGAAQGTPAGMLASGMGGMGSARLLPASEEEEEEQLRAALQLSLLEAAAGSTGGPTAGPGPGLEQRPPPAAAAAVAAERQPMPQQPMPPQQQSLEQLQGVHAAGSLPGCTGGAAAGPVRSSLMFPSLPATGPQLAPPALAPPPAAALSAAGRSSSHDTARVPPSLPPLPLGFISEPQQAEPRSGGATSQTHGSVSASMSASVDELPGMSAPLAASAAGNADRSGGAAATAASMGKGIVGEAHVDWQQQGMQAANAGANMYDIYTEDELLSLAVQLSLQESLGPGKGGV